MTIAGGWDGWSFAKQDVLSSGSVTSGNIASGQVGPRAIASGAITSGKIGSGAIQGSASYLNAITPAASTFRSFAPIPTVSSTPAGVNRVYTAPLSVPSDVVSLKIRGSNRTYLAGNGTD